MQALDLLPEAKVLRTDTGEPDAKRLRLDHNSTERFVFIEALEMVKIDYQMQMLPLKYNNTYKYCNIIFSEQFQALCVDFNQQSNLMAS